jgi:hypothetical protein
MSHAATTNPLRTAPRGLRRGTALLLLIGLAGHLFAADAIGGGNTAYLHHVGGFVLILAVTGGLLAALARFVWPRHWPVTLLTIGAIQAALGVWIALAPGSVSGG